ncbi:hypothetical protein ACSQ67_020126 [Phaseolus vulgaris]
MVRLRELRREDKSKVEREKTKSCYSILASLHKTTSIFAVQPQLPRRSRRRSPLLPGDSELGQSWCRASRASGKTVGKVLTADKGMDSARIIKFLEEFGVLVYFGEGTVAISDLGIVFTSCYQSSDFCLGYRNCDFLTIEIGLGLTGFGIFFSFLGVMFLFDKGLLAMGNILFVSGVSVTIGLKSTMQFFMKRSNFKGTISFGIGFFILILGWPILGMIVESYGFIVLFSGFWPTLAVFIQKIPVLGWLFQQPYIRSLLDRYRGKRVPV